MDRARLTGQLAELGHTPAGASGGRPVFGPASAEQAADLLGTCAREGWRVRLQGSGSRGPQPPDHDVVISARAMTGFDIYEPDDLTVGVRAGTTHREAADLLARHQQLLPLDAPGTASATLGGSLALGEAGPLRAGYGTPRDLTLGLTLVTGDGRVLRLGGQVVKNVAGYDLVRLVVGSRGTLGLITRLHVRLRSLPPSDVTILAELDDAAAAASLMIPLRDEVGPVALELVTPATPAERWRIALRLHGSPDVTVAASTAALRLLPTGRVLETDEAAAAWATLAAAEAAAPIRVRCLALPTALPALANAAATFLKSASDSNLDDWRGSAHATEAVLRLWGPEPDQARAGALAQCLAELRESAVNSGGTCVCDRGPESVRAQLAAPAPSSRLDELERALRLRFDPASVLVGS